MKHLMIAVIAIGLAVFITGPKLYKMARIKGWLPGATARAEVVTQKWHQLPSEHHRGRNVYWISWGATPIQQIGDHRLNLEKEPWDQIAVGDQVQLIQVPGDSSPYMRNDIFVSAGNFVVDICLFIGAISVGLWSLRRWRSSKAVGFNAI